MIERDDVIVTVPEDLTTKWSDTLNRDFGGGRFLLEVTTETWWTDPQRGRASAYLEPQDQGGPHGWRHDLKGIFDGMIYTNLPEASHVQGDGFMIGLKEAKLDASDDEIDPGHVVFAALHQIIGPLRFRLQLEESK